MTDLARFPAILVLVLASTILAGCATPVGVERRSPQAVHSELTGTVLTTGGLSQFSANLLRRYALDQLAVTEPAAALAALHNAVAADPPPDALFALAELSFQNAEGTGDQPHFLAAAIYAYAFLFPADADHRVSAFDPRVRWSTDIYNRALSQSFKAEDGAHFLPRGGARELPFGTLEISFDEAELNWGDRWLTELVPVADLAVRGLRNRHRQAGIGAPLAASTVAMEPAIGFQVGPRIKVPVTALLTLPNLDRDLATGRIRAKLELATDIEPETVELAGQHVPLEMETSAALAYTLSDPALWAIELRAFFGGSLLGDLPSQLVALQPHRPGRIPVVLVHGTASSAGRWADMVNDLQSDPLIHDRFEFWFFTYETGNPVPYSALVLRDALRAAVSELDPAGTDPALAEMVVVGHSQGGLLTKMTAIDTGDRLYDHIASRPLAELRLSEETRDLLQRGLFVEPLPFVRRLVFVSTPHGGSYLTEWSIGRLIGRLVHLPFRVARATAELITANRDALRFDPTGVRFGSLFGMTPGSPFITGLARIPVAQGVAAHSIVAIDGDGPPLEGGDGVVLYQSAHVPAVESELIVRSGHSSQANPHTIAEVRRILLLHAAEACASRGVACPSADASDTMTAAVRP